MLTKLITQICIMLHYRIVFCENTLAKIQIKHENLTF